MNKLNYSLALTLALLCNSAAVNAAVNENKIVVGGYEFKIDVINGDHRAEYDDLIRISNELHTLNEDDLNVRVPKLANAIRAKVAMFNEYSMQSAVLTLVSVLVEQIPNDVTDLKDRISHAADAVEAASRFFRFTLPGGMVIPATFPTDGEYVETVRNVMEPGSSLHSLLTALVSNL